MLNTTNRTFTCFDDSLLRYPPFLHLHVHPLPLSAAFLTHSSKNCTSFSAQTSHIMACWTAVSANTISTVQIIIQLQERTIIEGTHQPFRWPQLLQPGPFDALFILHHARFAQRFLPAAKLEILHRYGIKQFPTSLRSTGLTIICLHIIWIVSLLTTGCAH